MVLYTYVGVVEDDRICARVMEACGIELANLWNKKSMFGYETVAMYNQVNHHRGDDIRDLFKTCTAGVVDEQWLSTHTRYYKHTHVLLSQAISNTFVCTFYSLIRTNTVVTYTSSNI